MKGFTPPSHVDGIFAIVNPYYYGPIQHLVNRFKNRFKKWLTVNAPVGRS